MLRSANPGWLFCFGLFSTLAVGGLLMLATLDVYVIAGWIKLGWEMARTWVATAAR